MKTEIIIIDSNIIIDYLQGRRQAKALLDSYDQKKTRVLISIVTLIEVLVGISDGDIRERVRRWLLDFSPIQVCANIAQKAVELRKNLKLGVPDAIIASTAQYHQGVLVTRDKDFHKMPHVLYPYSLDECG